MAKQVALPKTMGTLRTIGHIALTCGGGISTAVFTLWLLNVKWVYENPKVRLAIIFVDIVIGLISFAFYFRYGNKVRCICNKKKKSVMNCRYHDAEEICKKADNNNTRARVDMLFANIVMIFCEIAVIKLISWASNTWQVYLSAPYVQTTILFLVHLTLIIIPMYAWGTKEIPLKYFSNLLEADSVVDYTAGCGRTSKAK